MYTQQLKHLKLDVDEIKQNLIANEYVKDFAIIVHDKDEDVEDHLHAFVKFTQKKSVDTVAKIFEDKPNYIEFFDKGNFAESNGYLYLLHRTKNASHKYHYGIDELILPENSKINSKIENWIMNYEQNVKKYQSKRRNTIVTSILNDYASEVITKKELKESLTNLELAKNQKLIKDIDKVLVDANYQKYIEDERYRDKKVIWIYGDSGTGKSLLSQKLASEHTDSEDIFVTSSNRDPFQEYFKESVLIIEELRPETNISANEFLQLLDKTNGRFSAGSRYSNKKIMADVIIINTIHHPRHFFTVNEPF